MPLFWENPCLRLYLAKTTLLKANIASSQTFLAFASFRTSKVLFWSHFRTLCLFFAWESCACCSDQESSSASFRFSYVLSFSLFFSAGDPWMVRTAKHTQCRSMSRTMIFHHERGLGRQSLHLWPLVQNLFSILFYDESSVHAADVSAHTEWRIFIELVRVHNNSRNVLLTASKV